MVIYLTREQELRKEDQEHSTAKVFHTELVPYSPVQNKLLDTAFKNQSSISLSIKEKQQQKGNSTGPGR